MPAETYISNAYRRDDLPAAPDWSPLKLAAAIEEIGFNTAKYTITYDRALHIVPALFTTLRFWKTSIAFVPPQAVTELINLLLASEEWCSRFTTMCQEYLGDASVLYTTYLTPEYCNDRNIETSFWIAVRLLSTDRENPLIQLFFESYPDLEISYREQQQACNG